MSEITRWIQSGQHSRMAWFNDDMAFASLAETMAAMANTHGGTLLIGVEGQSVIGVRDTGAAVDKALQAALSLDPHLIIPMPYGLETDGRTVVIVQIPSGMPHVYSLEGRYLQREGPHNTPLKPPDLRRLMIQRGELNFETEIAHRATLDDIDWAKARAYADSLQSLGDVREVLVKRGCLERQGDALKPTNAGILLFGKEPQRYIRGAEITAARFAGETMSDTFNRQDITGTLPDQIRRAETFLIDHLRKAVKLKSTMTRQEDFEYPMEAARELVVNAVAHRDYSIEGDGIRLFIFANRMEVQSPGGLPGPVTIQNIKDERFSRNPVIVQVLSDMGFIERLGYGVDRVIELMEKQHLQAPEFEERAGGFRVVLRQKKAVPERMIAGAPQFNGVFRGIEINPRQEGALAFLHQSRNTRITNSDLKSLFPDVHPETIRRDLADLVNKKILLKMGQKRGSYYVLSEENAE